MTKTKSIIPSQQLNVALPLPLYVQLTSHLYSELEGRVPHGGYSRFLIDLLRGYFTAEQFDLAPFTNTQPGAFTVAGSPEAVKALRTLLSNHE